MDISHFSTKQIGTLGERVASEYLRSNSYGILDRNVRASFGEIDIVAKSFTALHVIEVKTRSYKAFPGEHIRTEYDPTYNLDSRKIRKVSRLGQWYVERIGWEGEWQVDGIAIWLRECDGRAQVYYYPQLL